MMNALAQPHLSPATVHLVRLGVSAVFCAGLVACGGGNPEEPGRAATDSHSRQQALPAEFQLDPDAAHLAEPQRLQTTTGRTDRLWLESALLNAQELAEAGTPTSGVNETGTSMPVQAKTITRTPVHRFFNTQTSAHFYTISDAERAQVQAALPHFRYEGVAFEVSRTSSTGLSPVYRFYNTASGVHFYSISDAEKAHIEANLPQFRYEGVAYHASRTQLAGMRPLYRFFLSSRGFHFYSASESERDRIFAMYPDYRYESVAYHVLSPAALGPDPDPDPDPDPGPDPDPAPVEADCGLAGLRAELLSRINLARQSARVCGSQTLPAAPAVSWNDQLMLAATGHAVDMASNNYFSHTSLDGRRFDQRISAAGYPWTTAGENIAAGYNSVAAVMAGWMASEGHCRNIMGAAFTEVAVACSYSPSSTYGRYWVMNLGAR